MAVNVQLQPQIGNFWEAMELIYIIRLTTVLQHATIIMIVNRMGGSSTAMAEAVKEESATHKSRELAPLVAKPLLTMFIV